MQFCFSIPQLPVTGLHQADTAIFPNRTQGFNHYMYTEGNTVRLMEPKIRTGRQITVPQKRKSLPIFYTHNVPLRQNDCGHSITRFVQ